MSNMPQTVSVLRTPNLLGIAGVTLSALVYVFFLGAFMYTIAFVADVGVPKTIDGGLIGAPLRAALINLALLGQFGLQHSVMARPAFKRWWTKFIPESLERSVFVLAATVALVLLLWLWQPLPGQVWSVDNPLLATVLWTLCGVGWAVVLLSTFLLNHFELFGLQQSLLFATGQSAGVPSFKTPVLYRYVRHPLYLGFVIAFWATPHMSVGHLLFAIGCTGYILVGIFFEERDLITQFGDTYRRYQKRVPMLLPLRGRAD